MSRFLYIIAGFALLGLVSCEEMVIARPFLNPHSKDMFFEISVDTKTESYRLRDTMQLRPFDDDQWMITENDRMPVFFGTDQARKIATYLPNTNEIHTNWHKNDVPFIVLNNDFGIPFMFAHRPDMDPSILDGYAYVCNFMDHKWKCVSYGEDKTPPFNVFIAVKKDKTGEEGCDDLSTLILKNRLIAVVSYDFGGWKTNMICQEKNGCNITEYEEIQKSGRGLVEIDSWECDKDKDPRLCQNSKMAANTKSVVSRERVIGKYKKLDGLRMPLYEWNQLWTRDLNV